MSQQLQDLIGSLPVFFVLMFVGGALVGALAQVARGRR